MVCKKRQAIPRQVPFRSVGGMAVPRQVPFRSVGGMDVMKLARLRQGYLQSGLVVAIFVEGNLLSFDPSLSGN